MNPQNDDELDGFLPPQPNLLQAQQMQQAYQAQQNQLQQLEPGASPAPGPGIGGRYKKSRRYKKFKRSRRHKKTRRSRKHRKLKY
jgi:hypothetical protein